jgi:hypothetical protein
MPMLKDHVIDALMDHMPGSVLSFNAAKREVEEVFADAARWNTLREAALITDKLLRAKLDVAFEELSERMPDTPTAEQFNAFFDEWRVTFERIRSDHAAG